MYMLFVIESLYIYICIYSYTHTFTCNNLQPLTHTHIYIQTHAVIAFISIHFHMSMQLTTINTQLSINYERRDSTKYVVEVKAKGHSTTRQWNLSGENEVRVGVLALTFDVVFIAAASAWKTTSQLKTFASAYIFVYVYTIIYIQLYILHIQIHRFMNQQKTLPSKKWKYLKLNCELLLIKKSNWQ